MLNGDLLEWLTGCSLATQQWLSTKGKTKNLIIVQSMRLDVSVGLQYPLKS